MSISVHELVQWLEPELASSLVADETRPALRSLLARFPQRGQTQYLDCHLAAGSESAPVDLRLSVTRFEQDIPWQEDEPGMMPLRQFQANWNNPASILQRALPAAWLTFADLARHRTPAASLRVSLVPVFGDRRAPIQALSRSDVLVAFIESVRVIRERECPPRERRLLSRCIDRLPATAGFVGLSITTDPPPEDVALIVRLDGRELPTYLRHVDWAGDAERIGRLLQRYDVVDGASGRVEVELPIGGMLDPARARLTIAFPHHTLRSSREHDRAGRSLLHALDEDGFIGAERHDALATWPAVLGAGDAAADLSIERWAELALVYRAGQPLHVIASLGFAARSTGANALARLVSSSFPPPPEEPSPRQLNARQRRYDWSGKNRD